MEKDTELLVGNCTSGQGHEHDTRETAPPRKHHLELQKLKKQFPMPFKIEENAHTMKQEKQERND